MNKDGKTPLLDEQEKGVWPSVVKEIKKSGATKDAAKDLLGILERSYKTRLLTGNTAASSACSGTAGAWSGGGGNDTENPD